MFGSRMGKGPALDVVFYSYHKGNFNFDCGILRASFEIGVGEKAEFPGAMSFELVQWCKWGVVNCDRGQPCSPAAVYFIRTLRFVHQDAEHGDQDCD